MRIDLGLQRTDFCIFLLNLFLVYLAYQLPDLPHHIMEGGDQMSDLIFSPALDLYIEVFLLYLLHRI